MDSVEENGEPMDEPVHESISKLPPDTTASSDVSIKKDPMEVTKKVREDGVVAANEDPASMEVPIKKDPMQGVDQESLSKHLPNKPDDGVVAAKPAPAEPMDEEEPAMSVVVNLDRVVEKGTHVGPRRGERKRCEKKKWGE